MRHGVLRLWADTPGMATARVQKGDFEVAIKARGEIKALKSVTLAAPTTVTEVRLVKLAKSGSNGKIAGKRARSPLAATPAARR